MRSDPVEPAPLGLKIVAAAGLAFLHVPLALIVLYAFTTEEKSYVFPPPGLTTRWFAIAAARPDIWAALTLSLKVAAVATVLALLLGTCAAAALARARFFGREAISLLFVLPIALPGIITGIALRSAFNIMDLDFSFWTIVLGHATFCIVVVYNNAVARLRRTSPNLIEASMDLGADGLPDAAPYHLAGTWRGAPCRRHACLCAVVRRGHRHNFHRRSAVDIADLDADGADPATAAAGHQCRRRAGHRDHAAAHPCCLFFDTRRQLKF